jgi:hypothetical protein
VPIKTSPFPHRDEPVAGCSGGIGTGIDMVKRQAM